METCRICHQKKPTVKFRLIRIYVNKHGDSCYLFDNTCLKCRENQIREDFKMQAKDFFRVTKEELIEMFLDHKLLYILRAIWDSKKDPH